MCTLWQQGILRFTYKYKMKTNIKPWLLFLFLFSYSLPTLARATNEALGSWCREATMLLPIDGEHPYQEQYTFTTDNTFYFTRTFLGGPEWDDQRVETFSSVYVRSENNSFDLLEDSRILFKAFFKNNKAFIKFHDPSLKIEPTLQFQRCEYIGS